MIWRYRAPRRARPRSRGCPAFAAAARGHASRGSSRVAPACRSSHQRCCRCSPRSRCSTVFGWRCCARCDCRSPICISPSRSGTRSCRCCNRSRCSRSGALLRARRVFPRSSATTASRFPAARFEIADGCSGAALLRGRADRFPLYGEAEPRPAAHARQAGGARAAVRDWPPTGSASSSSCSRAPDRHAAHLVAQRALQLRLGACSPSRWWCISSSCAAGRRPRRTGPAHRARGDAIPRRGVALALLAWRSRR